LAYAMSRPRATGGRRPAHRPWRRADADRRVRQVSRPCA
jgi:hypothetical protein